MHPVCSGPLIDCHVVAISARMSQPCMLTSAHNVQMILDTARLPEVNLLTPVQVLWSTSEFKCVNTEA